MNLLLKQWQHMDSVQKYCEACTLINKWQGLLWQLISLLAVLQLLELWLGRTGFGAGTTQRNGWLTGLQGNKDDKLSSSALMGFARLKSRTRNLQKVCPY